MASALFAAQMHHHTESVSVSSAGIRAGRGLTPEAVPDEVLDVMDNYGIDLRDHRSRALTATMLQEADLVIGMGRRHVQEAVLLDSGSWPHAFMLKELVRRGELIGPRPPAQHVESWIAAVHGDRTRESLAHRSGADEVADPYGKALADYRSTAAELDHLTAQLTALLWPTLTGRPAGPS
jgi:protein-tyrosine phosphatase